MGGRGDERHVVLDFMDNKLAPNTRNKQCDRTLFLVVSLMCHQY